MRSSFLLPPAKRFTPLLFLAVLLTTVACENPVYDTGEEGRLLSVNVQDLPKFPEMRDWIPSLRIDVPAEPRAHEVNDQSLIEAIAAKDGAAMIGLKPAGASRTRDNGGIVPGIDKATAMAGRAVIQAMGGEITRTFRNTATVVVKIPPELGPKLREHPLVNFIEPVGTAALSSSSAASASNAVAINPSFYRFSQDTSWGVFKVNADDAWELENEGGSATIYVIDTGIDSLHRYSATGDADPYICTYYNEGFNDCFDGVADTYGHGSHVFGIANAVDNSYGYIGIAPSAWSVVMRVCTPAGQCNLDGVASALDWIEDRETPRRIVNMSFAGPDDSDAVALQLASLYNAGGLLVAAAGNTPTSPGPGVGYPGKYSMVIAVSGTLENDAFATPPYSCDRDIQSNHTTGSRHGSEVELSAPFWAWSMWSDQRYESECGTSMATPVVSGVAALVWTKWTSWDQSDVRSHLQKWSIDLGTGGRDQYFGYGRVDAMKALRPPVSATIDGPSTVSPMSSCLWDAAPTGGIPPYTNYSWSGVLSGSSSSVSGSVFSSGWLYLSVKDSNTPQATGYAQKYITVDPNGPPGCDE